MHPLPTTLASMGLLILLSGCASYGERCIEQGYKSGSPEFADCIERQIEQARRYETVRDKGPLVLRHTHAGAHH